MVIAVFNLDWNLVMYLLTSFVIGICSMLLYLRLKDLFSKSKQQPNQAVIEAIVSEYSRRLQNYDKGIGELRFKIDKLELLLTQRDHAGHINKVSSGFVGHDYQQESAITSQSDDDPSLRSHNTEVLLQTQSQTHENASLLTKSSVIPNDITASDITNNNHDMNYQNQ